MKSPVYLEEYRNNDLEKRALSLSTKPVIFIYTNYNENAVSAYIETGRNITELETSVDSINNGSNCSPAISGWYLSLASFLNTLLKVLCIKTQRDYTKIRSLSLAHQYLLILEISEVEVEVSHDQELCQKLEDFELLYHNLPYTLFDNEAINYKKANFSKLPINANQIDVFQSLLIALEVFEKLRFIISGLDLMPNISIITYGKNVVYEKLSVLRDKVLTPAFKDILIKYKLKTQLNISAKYPNYQVSSLFQIHQVYALSKYQEHDQYKLKTSPTATNILQSFYNVFMKKFIGQEDKYPLHFMTIENPLHPSLRKPQSNI